MKVYDMTVKSGGMVTENLSRRASNGNAKRHRIQKVVKQIAARAIAFFLAFILLTEAHGVILPAKGAEKYTKMKYISSLVRKTVGEDVKIKKKSIGKASKKYDISKKEAKYLLKALAVGILGEAECGGLQEEMTIAQAGAYAARAVIYKEKKAFSQSDTDMCLAKRMSDIDEIEDEVIKTDFAHAYMLGLVCGKSDGRYTHTRTFNPNRKAELKALKRILKKVADSELRYPISKDYQVIRKTKLPKNVTGYLYILDSFPNEFYDTPFEGMNAVDETGTKYIFNDVIMKMPLSERMSNGHSFLWPYEIDCDSLEYVEEAAEIFKYILNVDYRTIETDKEWRAALSKYMTDDEIDTVIADCIRNKTIVECDMTATDISAVNRFWGYFCKVYAHVRIVSDKGLENNDCSAAPGYMLPGFGPYWKPSSTRYVFVNRCGGSECIGEWMDCYFQAQAKLNIKENKLYMYGASVDSAIMTDYGGKCPAPEDSPAYFK